jgi:HAMP domain-containing protein
MDTAIHRIELLVVESALTPVQMQEEVAKANAEFQEMVDSFDDQVGLEKAPTVH